MARSALLNIMVTAAFKAGRSLTKDFGEIENLQVSVKGPADFVSRADHNAERIVHAELSKARPTYGFLMEEGGEIKGTDGQHRWIIDPLDGTTNFLHGIPLFAVAIALQRGDEIVASVIYNPVAEELYVAEKGGGAWLDDKKRLRVGGRNHDRFLRQAGQHLERRGGRRKRDHPGPAAQDHQAGEIGRERAAAPRPGRPRAIVTPEWCD